MATSVLAAWLTLPQSDDHAPDGGRASRRAGDGNLVNSANAQAVTHDPLVERVRSGDERAFSELVHTYGERLFRFAYRELGSRELAEELVQDVFANVWTRRAVWTVHQTVATYLFQAIRHRIHNARRAQRAADQLEETLVPADATLATQTSRMPDAALAESDLMAALDRALRRLPERPRQVFHLHREQQLAFRDIALVLDVSVRTVEHHMARAVAQLRHELAEWL